MQYENGRFYIGHSGDATAYVRQSRLLGYWRANLVKDRDIRQPFLLVPACAVDKMLEWGGFSARNATWIMVECDPVTQLDLESEPDATPEYVYFARKLGNGLLKIGYSRNPYGRITNFGADMRMLGLYPGHRSHEQDILRKFARYCVEGEWFKMARPIRQFILSNCYLPADPVYFDSPKSRTLAELIAEFEASKIMLDNVVTT